MNSILKKLKSLVKKYHRNVILLLLNTITITCFCLIYFYLNKTKRSDHLIYYQYYSDGGKCHNYEYVDPNIPNVPFLDKNFSPPQNAVYFHATSCKRSISSKDACIIESAARTNPERKIYVFLVEQPRNIFLGSPLLKQLQSYQNVQIKQIDMAEYAKGTALHSDMITHKRSQWRTSQRTSEILKYLTLLKWGGIVLDLDVMIVKSLSDLPQNWVGKESEYLIGTKAMALSMDDVARDVIAIAVKEMMQHLRRNTYLDHRGVLTKALLKICSSNSTLNMNTAACNGITVLDESHFYPIHRSSWRTFLGSRRPYLSRDPHAFTIWSSRSTPVARHSYLAQLAMKYCPTTYELFGDEFGA